MSAALSGKIRAMKKRTGGCLSCGESLFDDGTNLVHEDGQVECATALAPDPYTLIFQSERMDNDDEYRRAKTRKSL